METIRMRGVFGATQDTCGESLTLVRFAAYRLQDRLGGAVADPACRDRERRSRGHHRHRAQRGGDARSVALARWHQIRDAQARAHAFRQPAEIERARSEEHTSELQSLMRISYAVF